MTDKPKKTTLFALSLLALILLVLPGCDSTSPEADRGLRDAHVETVTPEDFGWSSARLEGVRQHAESLGTAALMILTDGEVVAAWGDVERTFVMASIRKSLLSALYGIYRAEGPIDLSQTMADLGIDDEPPLTNAEKQATVADLLKARSGVYHEAASETPGARNARPLRGSHPPGAFWYYNNWDFNVLGTIFEQRTGIGIYDALEQRLGRPLQMQDFTADNGRYYDQEALSAHPVYHFDMSARDMARFGLLYLRRGCWRGRQLIPAAWIDRSTTPYSDVGDERRGYGYMWWIGKAEAFGGHALYMARGGDGHALYVVPALDVVVVHRIDRLTFARGWDEVYQLLVMILKAHPRDGASQ